MEDEDQNEDHGGDERFRRRSLVHPTVVVGFCRVCPPSLAPFHVRERVDSVERRFSGTGGLAHVSYMKKERARADRPGRKQQ